MRGSVLSFRGMTPTRDQVNPEDTWDLTQLYADGAAWERDFSTLQRQYPSLALFEGKLCGSAAVLRDALEASRQMNLLI